MAGVDNERRVYGKGYIEEEKKDGGFGFNFSLFPLVRELRGIIENHEIVNRFGSLEEAMVKIGDGKVVDRGELSAKEIFEDIEWRKSLGRRSVGMVGGPGAGKTTLAGMLVEEGGWGYVDMEARGEEEPVDFIKRVLEEMTTREGEIGGIVVDNGEALRTLTEEERKRLSGWLRSEYKGPFLVFMGRQLPDMFHKKIVADFTFDEVKQLAEKYGMKGDDLEERLAELHALTSGHVATVVKVLERGNLSQGAVIQAMEETIGRMTSPLEGEARRHNLNSEDLYRFAAAFGILRSFDPPKMLEELNLIPEPTGEDSIARKVSNYRNSQEMLEVIREVLPLGQYVGPSLYAPNPVFRRLLFNWFRVRKPEVLGNLFQSAAEACQKVVSRGDMYNDWTATSLLVDLVYYGVVAERLATGGTLSEEFEGALVKEVGELIDTFVERVRPEKLGMLMISDFLSALEGWFGFSNDADLNETVPKELRQRLSDLAEARFEEEIIREEWEETREREFGVWGERDPRELKVSLVTGMRKVLEENVTGKNLAAVVGGEKKVVVVGGRTLLPGAIAKAVSKKAGLENLGGTVNFYGQGPEDSIISIVPWGEWSSKEISDKIGLKGEFLRIEAGPYTPEEIGKLIRHLPLPEQITPKVIYKETGGNPLAVNLMVDRIEEGRIGTEEDLIKVLNEMVEMIATEAARAYRIGRGKELSMGGVREGLYFMALSGVSISPVSLVSPTREALHRGKFKVGYSVDSGGYVLEPSLRKVILSALKAEPDAYKKVSGMIKEIVLREFTYKLEWLPYEEEKEIERIVRRWATQTEKLHPEVKKQLVAEIEEKLEGAPEVGEEVKNLIREKLGSTPNQDRVPDQVSD